MQTRHILSLFAPSKSSLVFFQHDFQSTADLLSFFPDFFSMQQSVFLKLKLVFLTPLANLTHPQFEERCQFFSLYCEETKVGTFFARSYNWIFPTNRLLFHIIYPYLNTTTATYCDSGLQASEHLDTSKRKRRRNA